MYIRINKQGNVDAVVPTAVGTLPTVPDGDYVLVFATDINPSKILTLEVPIQATDKLGNLLFNADGTPQWETQTDAEGNVTIVTQPQTNTVTLNDSPSSFVASDFNGLGGVVYGSQAHIEQQNIAALEAGLNATLAGGFTSKTTGHTYVTSENGQSNMEGELQRFTLDPSLTSVMFYTTDAGWVAHTQTQLQSAFLDGGLWKDAQYAQFNTLSSQGASTWTPATY